MNGGNRNWRTQKGFPMTEKTENPLPKIVKRLGFSR